MSGPFTELVSASAWSGCWAFGTVWSGLPFSSAQLRFRTLDFEDVPSLVALFEDEDVARWAVALPNSLGETEARDYIERVRQENRMVFAIETLANNTFIGCINVEREADRIGYIGYSIRWPFWVRGYGEEALKRVVRFAFEQTDFDAIEVELMKANMASETVLAKAGFNALSEGVGCYDRYESEPIFRYVIAREDWASAVDAKPTVLVVAVAMVDPDGRVLMARRPDGKKLSGLWEFPGGKVDKGETLEAALIRELDEELGVDTRSSCLAPLTFASHEYEDFHLLMPLYVCRVWQGRPVAREGQELAWVHPQRMRNYPMPPADEPLVAMLCDLI